MDYQKEQQIEARRQHFELIRICSYLNKRYEGLNFKTEKFQSDNFPYICGAFKFVPPYIDEPVRYIRKLRIWFSWGDIKFALEHYSDELKNCKVINATAETWPDVYKLFDDREKSLEEIYNCALHKTNCYDVKKNWSI